MPQPRLEGGVYAIMAARRRLEKLCQRHPPTVPNLRPCRPDGHHPAHAVLSIVLHAQTSQDDPPGTTDFTAEGAGSWEDTQDPHAALAAAEYTAGILAESALDPAPLKPARELLVLAEQARAVGADPYQVRHHLVRTLFAASPHLPEDGPAAERAANALHALERRLARTRASLHKGAR